MSFMTMSGGGKMGFMPTGDAFASGDGEQDGFARAFVALTAAVGPADDLCGPILGAVPVAGVVISTLGNPLGSQTVCATSVLAERVDEIQIDLGEGPCWDARHSGNPVFVPDLQDVDGSPWPAARAAFRDLGIGSIHAFPLRVGPLTVGSLDLYSMAPQRLTPVEVVNVTSLAAIAARHVIRRALEEAEDPGEEMPAGRYSRREVHQASGMVAAQMDISAQDALMVLRGHAFAEGLTVREVAEDVLRRRLNFGG